MDPASAIALVTGNSTGTALLIAGAIVTLVLIVLIIFYVVMAIKNRGKDDKTLIKTFRHLQRQPQTFSSLPTLINDAEYTYTAWFYLSSLTMTQVPQLVMARGSSGGRAPVIFMHPKTNSMYIALATNNSRLAYTGAPDSNLSKLIPGDSGYASSGYMTAAIDYFPLQRWVHLAVVVRQDTMSVFVNGDLYTVRSVHDKRASATAVRPMLLRPTGELKVGSNTGPDAYIARLKFINYALLHADVQKDFKAGPNPSWAFGSYKLRSPIVKEGEVGASSCTA